MDSPTGNQKPFLQPLNEWLQPETYAAIILSCIICDIVYREKNYLRQEKFKKKTYSNTSVLLANLYSAYLTGPEAFVEISLDPSFKGYKNEALCNSYLEVIIDALSTNIDRTSKAPWLEKNIQSTQIKTRKGHIRVDKFNGVKAGGGLRRLFEYHEKQSLKREVKFTSEVVLNRCSFKDSITGKCL